MILLNSCYFINIIAITKYGSLCYFYINWHFDWEHVWNILTTRVERIENTCGTHWEHVWNALRTRVERIENTCGTHWEHVWNALRTRVERIENTCGTHWEHVWNALGYIWCETNISKISVTSLYSCIISGGWNIKPTSAFLVRKLFFFVYWLGANHVKACILLMLRSYV